MRYPLTKQKLETFPPDCYIPVLKRWGDALDGGIVETWQRTECSFALKRDKRYCSKQYSLYLVRECTTIAGRFRFVHVFALVNSQDGIQRMLAQDWSQRRPLEGPWLTLRLKAQLYSDQPSAPPCWVSPQSATCPAERANTLGWPNKPHILYLCCSETKTKLISHGDSNSRCLWFSCGFNSYRSTLNGYATIHLFRCPAVDVK